LDPVCSGRGRSCAQPAGTAFARRPRGNGRPPWVTRGTLSRSASALETGSGEEPRRSGRPSASAGTTRHLEPRTGHELPARARPVLPRLPRLRRGRRVTPASSVRRRFRAAFERSQAERRVQKSSSSSNEETATWLRAVEGRREAGRKPGAGRDRAGRGGVRGARRDGADDRSPDNERPSRGPSKPRLRIEDGGTARGVSAPRFIFYFFCFWKKKKFLPGRERARDNPSAFDWPVDRVPREGNGMNEGLNTQRTRRAHTAVSPGALTLAGNPEDRPRGGATRGGDAERSRERRSRHRSTLRRPIHSLEADVWTPTRSSRALYHQRRTRGCSSRGSQASTSSVRGGPRLGPSNLGRAVQSSPTGSRSHSADGQVGARPCSRTSEGACTPFLDGSDREHPTAPNPATIVEKLKTGLGARSSRTNRYHRRSRTASSPRSSAAMTEDSSSYAKADRHWPVPARPLDEGQRAHARPQPDLLAEGQAVPRQGRVPPRAGHNTRILQLEGGQVQVAQQHSRVLRAVAPVEVRA
jgi:hypothetical protein